MNAIASGNSLPPALTGIAALIFVLCLAIVASVIFLVTLSSRRRRRSRVATQAHGRSTP